LPYTSEVSTSLYNYIMNKEQLIFDIDLALNEIRPHLAVDGGNIEVVNVTDEMMVQIKWLGNCQSCNISTMTLKMGVEQTIKAKLPQIVGVEAV
jgi:Fe-S cluster biogenesis protein NfuA